MNGSRHFSSIGAVVAHTCHFYGAPLEVYILDRSFGAGVIATHNLDGIALAKLSIALLQLFTKGLAQGCVHVLLTLVQRRSIPFLPLLPWLFCNHKIITQ
jgi:hypothetical protein